MTNDKQPQHLAGLEKEIHLTDYINVVLRRWKIVLLVFLFVFTSVAVYTFTKEPVYEASSSMEVGGNKQGGLIAELQLGSDGAVATEIEKLRSRTLAERVIRKLNLHWQLESFSSDFTFGLREFNIEGDLAALRIELTGPDSFRVVDSAGRQLGQAKAGEVCVFPQGRILVDFTQGVSGAFIAFQRVPVDDILTGFMTNLSVAEVGKMTNVIRVSFRDTDPTQARDVVNLIIDGYLTQNVTSRTLEAGMAVDFISTQLKGVKDKLDRSEQKLQEYKVQTGLATLGPEGNSIIEKMVSLEQQQAEFVLKRKRIDFAISTLHESMRSGEPFTPPTIEGAQKIDELSNTLAALEAEYKSYLVDYTPAHPLVIEVKAQVRRVQETMLSAYRAVSQEIMLSGRDTASIISDFDAQLKEIPATELELAKRMRVNQVNAELYTFLLEKQQEASIAEASTISNAEVIDRAVTPLKPVGPNKRKNLALGFILGLMLGIGLVFLLDYMDQTIKTSEDVKEKLGLNVFGIIPRIPFADEDAKLPRKRLVTTLGPKTPVVEAFRALRTNLNFITAKEKHKIILVTSSMPNEGKSTVSGNLAVVLSQTGAKVLLIGADLRRPQLFEMFGVKNEPGLVNLLMNDDQNALRHLTNPRLDFLPAGTIPPNPAEILDSTRMAKLLDKVRERYDYVVIDAPPVLPVTDAQILAPKADINLVVIEPCRVPEKAALQMVETLRSVDAKIAGVILNDKTGRGFKYYGNYSYYGNKSYRGYYGEENDEIQDGVIVRAIKTVWGKLNS